MPGDWATSLLLCLAAFGAGIINALAGGGTLLTFPALTAVTSLVQANATSTVALVPGSLASAWGYRRELEGARAWLGLLLLPSLLGGVIGALLLTRLPERYFALVIPWLLLTASLLFLVQPTLSRFVLRQKPGELPGRATRIAVIFFQLLVAVYGGYFGAGIGILMLAALSFMGIGDIHRMNALKTVLGTCINGVSVIIFVLEGRVSWYYAAIMAAAAIVGGYLGAHYGRQLPRALVRSVVVLIGVGLAIHYFLR